MSIQFGLIFYFLIILFIAGQRCQRIVESHESSASDAYTGFLEDKTTTRADEVFVYAPQPPRLLQHRFPLLVQFSCNNNNRSNAVIVGVDIRVWTESQDGVAIFRRRLNCSSYGNGPHQKVVRLTLPRYLAYRPGYSNRYAVFVERAVIQLWALDAVAYRSLKVQSVKLDAPQDFYEAASAREEIECAVLPPFERPSRPARLCLSLPSRWLFTKATSFYSPKCPAEDEVVYAVKFPVALSGSRTGVHRKFYEYKNRDLRRLRKKAFMNLQYSYLFWIYVTDYCPENVTVCSLVQQITWDDLRATPQININKHGQIQHETIMENGTSRTFLSAPDFIVPKDEWVQLIIACETYQCNVTTRTANRWHDIRYTLFNMSRHDVPYMDDALGFFVFGGSELVPSFQGYIGQAIFYRRKVVRPEETSIPNKNHAMFELGLNQREERCRQYIQQVNFAILQSTTLLKDIVRRKSCRNVFLDLIAPKSDAKRDEALHCKIYNAPRSPHYKYVRGLVRQWTLDGRRYTLEDVGTALYKNATYMLEKNNMREMEIVISLLKQGSCFGNHDATFMLSVILNYGISIASQEIQSHSYLMYGALSGNRLCLMSLGNKHVFGMDGIPMDLEQAYVYYKNIADLTRDDMESHREDDIFTEMIRLTNKDDIAAQTDETGDYFLWLKHQASQGVVSAQRDVARLLYWGSQGIQRDIYAALQYYRMSAESGDPAALYDYGIVLLKGHGTEKNVTLAMEVLEKAAAQDHREALNTIGWYALEIQKNHSRAAHYFHRSYDLGNKDAAYNLAHMYLRGYYPNSTIDRVKAWEYLANGALRGQLEAGTLVGMYNVRGHPNIERNVRLGVEWARFVGEQNPVTGILLSKGLKAYRKNNWPTAFIFYVMAASTGVEVANFNLAYLCEEDIDGLVAFMEKECKWRHYNLSTQRLPKNVNPYAWIKMGEYHYSGAGGKERDPQAAADLYCSAAIYGDPQGLFSLGALVEEGFQIADATWHRLEIPTSVSNNNVSLLTHLYSRCKESYNDDAFIPCTIALYRIQAIYIWTRYHILIMMLVMTGLAAILILAVKNIYNLVFLIRQEHQRRNNAFDDSV